MASSGGFGVPVVAVLLLGLGAAASAQLSATFYDASCPSALATIKSGVTAAVSKEARMGASLLRLHFHDCFVQGCDASVLLADTANFTGEQTAFPNAIRGPDVIDAIKAQVEAVCPQTVSCADILAVAARDSIVALGGPSYTVPLGRRDSTGASLPEANSDLPPPTSDLADLVGNFSRKGLSVTDMVALSAPETTEETYVEISDTEPEDPAASASTIDYPVEYYLDPSSGRYFVEVPPEDDDEIDLVQ